MDLLGQATLISEHCYRIDVSTERTPLKPDIERTDQMRLSHQCALLHTIKQQVSLRIRISNKQMKKIVKEFNHSSTAASVKQEIFRNQPALVY